jgi:hypothetical protein
MESTSAGALSQEHANAPEASFEISLMIAKARKSRKIAEN